MLSRQSLLKCLALSIGLLLLCNWAATAQETRGAILGTVKDATGAVVDHLFTINALNNVHYQGLNTDITSSNFGKITAQNNIPRWIQFQLRFTF